MKFRYILAAAALFSFVSCNEKEVFEKEQYKNIFGFVCESDNTKEKIVSLHLDEATTYVSISMGGSNTISQDVTINFEEDPSLIDAYNASNFDTDVADKDGFAEFAKNNNLPAKLIIVPAPGYIMDNVLPKNLYRHHSMLLL